MWWVVLLLLAVMGMGAFLAVDGLFDGLERWLVARAHTPTALLGWIVWPAGGLAAFVTNVFDDQYVTGVNNITANTFGTPFASISEPRTWGFDFRVAF